MGDGAAASYSKDGYFANLEGLELATALHDRAKKYYQRLPRTTAWRRYIKALAQFYGLPTLENPFDVTALGVAGEKGELTTARVGHVGAIGRHIITLVTATKPAWQPVPVNTDYDSTAETSFCTGLLDYYFREEGIEDALVFTITLAVIFGHAFYVQTWKPRLGDVYAMGSDGRPVVKADGDPEACSLTPLEVAVDLDRSDTKHDWWITRRLVNRWDLVARYAPPALEGLQDDRADLRDAIIGHRDDMLPQTGGGTVTMSERQSGEGEKDLVPLYEFFHEKTPACPNGAWAQYLSGDIMLGSGALPYPNAPILIVEAGRMALTPYGDSSLHQLGGLQDLTDNLVSALATNNTNCATQIVAVPDDAEWDSNSILGMTILKCPTVDGRLVKPESVNLTASAPETYKLVEMLGSIMSNTGGVNNVVQGEVPTDGSSGSLAALIHQQAIRFQSGLARNWEKAIAGSGNILLKQLQRFATAPKQAVIAGKAKNFMLQSFTSDKLKNINRVQVESANPITKRPEFKVQMARDLLTAGVITSVEQFIEVVESGRVESMTESPLTELLNLRKENELLREGQVPVLPPFTDHHPKHIQEHRAVLDDPQARTNPTVVHAALAHIQEHMNVWRQAPPDLLMVLGIPPPPPPPGVPQPPPGGPQGGPLPPPGQHGQQPPPAQAQAQGAPAGHASGGPPAMPNQPKLPTNPSTGRQWNPTDGGAPS
jgi:hypothetical protein